MPKFEIYRDTSGGWRWRLVATNGRIVADSAEGYTTKHKAIAAAENVAYISVVAEIEKECD